MERIDGCSRSEDSKLVFPIERKCVQILVNGIKDKRAIESTVLHYLSFGHAVGMIDVVVTANTYSIYTVHECKSPNGPVFFRSQSRCPSRSGRLWTPPTMEEEELEGSDAWRSEPNYHPPTYCFQEHETLQSQSQSHVASITFNTRISLKLSLCKII